MVDLDALAQRLQDVWPHVGAVTAGPLDLLSAGWESDIYTIPYGPAGVIGRLPASEADAVVARLYYGDGAGEKAAREFGVMARLAGAGYACPTPLWVETDAEAWGRPALIMTRAPGSPMWAQVYRGDAAARAVAHGRYIRQFAALHALDVRACGLDAVLDVPTAGDAVAVQVSRTRAFAAARPDLGFAPALQWLAHAGRDVAPGRVGLLHWDFHPENLLGAADGAVTVIDWSGAEVGDTRFDVAWSMVVVGSQEGPQAAVELLAAYAAGTGAAGTDAPPDMDYFLTFATMRRLYVMTLALVHGAAVLGLRPGAEGAIRGQLPAMARLYDQWLAAAGIRLPTLEAVLAAEN